MEGIIAECGNHHFGELSKAKDLIRLAKACGARYVKFQAIDPEQFISGSMPREFYRQCDLHLSGYLELITEAYREGIEIFFSIFGPKYKELRKELGKRPHKISGGQFLSMPIKELEEWNFSGIQVVTSIPAAADEFLLERKPYVTNMHLMYVTPYQLSGNRDYSKQILHYADLLEKPIGFSDHSPEISQTVKAIDTGCMLIEKHFNIYGQQYFKGRIYRDSLHAASVKELALICKHFQKVHNPCSAQSVAQ